MKTDRNSATKASSAAVGVDQSGLAKPFSTDLHCFASKVSSAEAVDRKSVV